MKHQKSNQLFFPVWRRKFTGHLFLIIYVTLSWGSAWAKAGFSFNFKSKPAKDPALSSMASDDAVVVYQWEEDTAHFEENKPKVLTDDKAKSKQRRLFWMGRLEDGGTSSDPFVRPNKKSSSPGSGSTSPHLLRMEQWDLTFAWKEHKRNRSKAIKFEFNENGYVRSLHPDNRSHQSKSTDVTENPRNLLWKHGNNQQRVTQLQLHEEKYVIGTWKLAPLGVTWKMSWDGKTYSFYAELHLNPFGQYPKMFRGLVIRDRYFPLVSKRFMRPIVATFSGRGAGMDTADFSYKNRQVQ